MIGIFKNCKKLEKLELYNFDTSNVCYMNDMFFGCSSLKNINLSNFVTKRVKTMDGMFSNCTSLKKLDLSNFDSTSLFSLSFMFYQCSSLQYLNIEKFTTFKGENITGIFNGNMALKKLVCKDNRIRQQNSDKLKIIYIKYDE